MPGLTPEEYMIIKERKYMPSLHPEENNPQEICGSVTRNDMVPGVADWNVSNISYKVMKTESMVLLSFTDTPYALLTEWKLFLYAAAFIIIQEEEMWPGDALDKLAHSPPGAIAMFYDAVPSVDPRLPIWTMFADCCQLKSLIITGWSR